VSIYANILIEIGLVFIILPLLNVNRIKVFFNCFKPSLYIERAYIDNMAKLRFKKQCRICKSVWIEVEARQPVVCDACKRKIKKSEDADKNFKR
jgi:hypothetical protein